MNIFLAIPFGAAFDDISFLIRETSAGLGHNIITANELYSTGTIIEQVQDQIKNVDLVIADISGHNPNVMYELGYAQSSGIPILPLAQRGDNIPFDIAAVRVIIYDRERLQQTLITPIRNFLSHKDFGDFFLKESAKFEKAKEKIKSVFVSYSHADSQYLNRLKVHLRPFEKRGLIDLWEDTKIKAGEKWKERIEKALDKCSIAILLISADFLASDFIIDNELPPLLKLAEEHGKIILPVIVKPCRFTRDPNLSIFQAINDPKKPLSKLDENGREEIYVEIADYIEDSIKS
ncbi:toll/interleukin-1 receptor domain-containing protein [Mucilaginibacter celer]|uniref:TIR domain-containing protein n=1 Tax=Mucilaginibacter celer TaxID=2305508 RepID=A0A494VQK7_9SPHI|nr:toll/interleukin-1 receptor domain-containing protein [Mucilaginibacter celer]AYL95550.1 TIR domain-containing protein [Mucilaginibacter celer]